MLILIAIVCITSGGDSISSNDAAAANDEMMGGSWSQEADPGDRMSGACSTTVPADPASIAKHCQV